MDYVLCGDMRRSDQGFKSWRYAYGMGFLVHWLAGRVSALTQWMI